MRAPALRGQPADAGPLGAVATRSHGNSAQSCSKSSHETSCLVGACFGRCTEGIPAVEKRIQKGAAKHLDLE